MYTKSNFKLKSEFSPNGDQPNAIKKILNNLKSNQKHQTLMGVTGSGKTFTMANVIQEYNTPTLVLSHNKTLAAQLYGELKTFFPENSVEYFISYYDYYQPEAYLPTSDTYIEKTTAINEEIEKLRLKATASLVGRNDVIIVASVSCIYGLGSPADYKELSVNITVDTELDRKQFFEDLINIQYTRNKYDLSSGSFRVKGDIIDIFPAYDEKGIRIETFGEEVENIKIINFLTGEVLEERKSIDIYPSKHFVVSKPKVDEAIGKIEEELELSLDEFKRREKYLEHQRLEQRTRMDIEFLKEMGMCSGIENYSRHLGGRNEGDPPYCLLDFFPDDFLMIIDESHVTLPQIRAMYNGDRARKKVLVEHGFRLPSALDNRPLKFPEFESIKKNILYLSATPANYEIEQSGGEVIEQVIRPTGILDPEIFVRPVVNQIDDLISEIEIVKKREERILVTTLTKRMSEDLSVYLVNHGIKAKYLHSEISSIDRVMLIRELRLGEIDVLVGINLLREGLDMPEVSLVAVLDADREGFLRDKRSLLQISGRAARNVNSKVIFYAENVTDSMQGCIDEVYRRREIQQKYNDDNNITPKTVKKSISDIMKKTTIDDDIENNIASEEKALYNSPGLSQEENIKKRIAELTKEMKKVAADLKFEQAAKIRDEIGKLKKKIETL